MKRMTWTCSLLLALLVLTACGKEPAPETASRIVYVPQTVEFTTGLRAVDSSCIIGETVYLSGRTSNDASAPPQILRLSLEGGEAEPLPDYQPVRLEGGSTYSSYTTLQAGTDGTLWVEETLSNVEYGQTLPGRTIPEGGSKGSRFESARILRHLDGDGKELLCFSAREPELADYLGLGDVYGLKGDGEGTVWVLCQRGLAALKEDGTLDFTLPVNSWNAAILLSDGRLAVSGFFQDGTEEVQTLLRAADQENRSWGESFALPPSGYSVYGGNGDDLFYFKTSTALCAWRTETGEGEQIMDLMDISAGDSVSLASRLPDGRVVLLGGNGWRDAEELELTVLTPTDAALSDRKVLTCAAVQLTSDLESAIRAFNQSSPDYRITVTDYSQFGGRQEALTRLATEIGAGKMPDILSLYGIPVSNWAASGLLEDLWPYIDSDPELGRDALMERVFQAAEIDGKLYEISKYFWITTLTGPRSAVGDRMTWTAEDLWASLEKMPEGCVPLSVSRGELLEHLMSLDWSRFVDWETGTCDFESEEFKSLLETCAGFPEYPSVSVSLMEQRLYEHEQMLMSWSVTGFTFPQQARFFLGDEVSFVGYPNPWGEVGSSFTLVSALGMTSACGDKEGAWSFLRTMLLPEHEAAEPGFTRLSSSYFPTNKADFQARAEQLMTPRYLTGADGTDQLDSEGEKIQLPLTSESFSNISRVLDYYAVTQEDYDQLMALYNAIDTVNRWDPDLGPIIREVAGAYFAGDKSLDETAALIQNRASLYVNENR